MRYLFLLIIVPFIIVMSYGGCNNECVNCVPDLPRNCTDFQDLFESECFAETLSNSCFGMSCGEDPNVSVPVGLALFCEEIDCTTMECGDLLFTDLGINEEGQVNGNVMEDGVELGNLSCNFFQP